MKEEITRYGIEMEFDYAVIDELDKLCKKYHTKEFKQEPEEMDLGETMCFYGVQEDGFENVIKAMSEMYSIDLSDITYSTHQHGTMLKLKNLN